jgi:hypothetical protein
MPPLPALPTFGSRAEWKQWRRMQRNWDEERKRREKLAFKLRKEGGDASRPIEERIASWRNTAMGGMSTVAVLGVVGVLSHGFWWAVWPVAFISLGIVTKAGRLWADGVPVSRLLSRGTIPSDHPFPEHGHDVHMEANRMALRLAPSHVLAGPHGDAVRRAASDRAVVEDTIRRLAKSEREMIPDVVPTVVALSERVGSLAVTLHGLDVDVSVASVGTLEQRVSALRAESGPEPTPEQERRIALLERQRSTIADLVERRRVLASQMESALLALQNLRLDLLKLRSSGLESAMSDVSSATQEARAISRDIGHAVDAIGEARRL